MIKKIPVSELPLDHITNSLRMFESACIYLCIVGQESPPVNVYTNLTINNIILL